MDSIRQCSNIGHEEIIVDKNYALTVFWLHEQGKPANSRQSYSKRIEEVDLVNTSIKNTRDCLHQHGCSRLLLQAAPLCNAGAFSTAVNFSARKLAMATKLHRVLLTSKGHITFSEREKRKRTVQTRKTVIATISWLVVPTNKACIHSRASATRVERRDTREHIALRKTAATPAQKTKISAATEKSTTRKL